MTDNTMKDKIASGLFWKLLENGGAQGIQFIVAILLARLMTQEEYGTISIIMIFITVANVVVQNGFSTALVQKYHADEKDFSSVFYFDLAVAAVMYGALWLGAPAIAAFYSLEILTPLVRVLGVVLFPGAVISVQTAYVSREMNFKGLFKATFFAVVVSGAISIVMACRGMGVWALAGQQIAYYFALMAGLFFDVDWRPTRAFSSRRVKSMFGFGWKLLGASLLDTLFNNLYGLMMGKIYNEAVLGTYNRGEQFPKLIVTNLGAAIQSVLLPAFSKAQDQVEEVRNMVRKAIEISSFVVLPMLLGMFAVADTMVLALLGERWLDCVPFLRIMCIAYCFYPIHITNLQAINAMGRSDIFLKLEVIKKAVGITGLLVGIRYGAIVLVSIKAFVDFVCIFINAWPNKRLLRYSIVQQAMDIAPSFLMSLIMAAAVWFTGKLIPGVWLRLVIQIVAGAGIYGGMAWAVKARSLGYLMDYIKEKRRGS